MDTLKTIANQAIYAIGLFAIAAFIFIVGMRPDVEYDVGSTTPNLDEQYRKFNDYCADQTLDVASDAKVATYSACMSAIYYEQAKRATELFGKEKSF